MKDADALVESLLADPETFWAGGSVNALIIESRGTDLDHLRPLVGSPDLTVQRLFVHTLSELGRESCPLVRDAVQLLDVDDRFVTYNVFEVLILCAVGSDSGLVWPLYEGLDHEDQVIRRLSMRLLRNADATQWRGALTEGRARSELLHVRCIERVVSASDPIAESASMLDADHRLVRSYGMVLALRHHSQASKVILSAKTSPDADVSETAVYMAKVLDLNTEGTLPTTSTKS